MASSSSPFEIAVFLVSNLNTHLAVPGYSDDSVASLKRKIELYHPIEFPEFGDVIVKAIKLKRKGTLYYLIDSAPIINIVTKGNQLLHIEVEPAQQSESEPSIEESTDTESNEELNVHTSQESIVLNSAQVSSESEEIKGNSELRSEDSEGLEDESVHDEEMLGCQIVESCNWLLIAGEINNEVEIRTNDDLLINHEEINQVNEADFRVANNVEIETKRGKSRKGNVEINDLVGETKRRKMSNESQSSNGTEPETENNLVTDNTRNNEIHETEITADNENIEPIDNKEKDEQGVTESGNPIPDPNQEIMETENPFPVTESENPIPDSKQEVTESENPIPDYQEVMESENPIPNSNQDVMESENPIPDSNQDVIESENPIPDSNQEVESENPIPDSNQEVNKRETPILDSNQEITESENLIPESNQGGGISNETKKEKSKKKRKKAKSEAPLVREREMSEVVPESQINEDIKSHDVLNADVATDKVNPNQDPETFQETATKSKSKSKKVNTNKNETSQDTTSTFNTDLDGKKRRKKSKKESENASEMETLVVDSNLVGNENPPKKEKKKKRNQEVELIKSDEMIIKTTHEITETENPIPDSNQETMETENPIPDFNQEILESENPIPDSNQELTESENPVPDCSQVGVTGTSNETKKKKSKKGGTKKNKLSEETNDAIDAVIIKEKKKRKNAKGEGPLVIETEMNEIIPESQINEDIESCDVLNADVVADQVNPNQEPEKFQETTKAKSITKSKKASINENETSQDITTTLNGDFDGKKRRKKSKKESENTENASELETLVVDSNLAENENPPKKDKKKKTRKQEVESIKESDELIIRITQNENENETPQDTTDTLNGDFDEKKRRKKSKKESENTENASELEALVVDSNLVENENPPKKEKKKKSRKQDVVSIKQSDELIVETTQNEKKNETSQDPTSTVNVDFDRKKTRKKSKKETENAAELETLVVDSNLVENEIPPKKDKKKKRRKQEVESIKEPDELIVKTTQNENKNETTQDMTSTLNGDFGVKRLNKSKKESENASEFETLGMDSNLVENENPPKKDKKKRRRKQEVESIKESDELIVKTTQNESETSQDMTSTFNEDFDGKNRRYKSKKESENAAELETLAVDSNLVKNEIPLKKEKKKKRRKQEVESIQESDELVLKTTQNENISSNLETVQEETKKKSSNKRGSNEKGLILPEASNDKSEETLNPKDLINDVEFFSDITKDESGMTSGRSGGDEKRAGDDSSVLAQTPKKKLDLGVLFRSTRSYQKAKVSASQSQLEESELAL